MRTCWFAIRYDGTERYLLASLRVLPYLSPLLPQIHQGGAAGPGHSTPPTPWVARRGLPPSTPPTHPGARHSPSSPWPRHPSLYFSPTAAKVAVLKNTGRRGTATPPEYPGRGGFKYPTRGAGIGLAYSVLGPRDLPWGPTAPRMRYAWPPHTGRHTSPGASHQQVECKHTRTHNCSILIRQAGFAVSVSELPKSEVEVAGCDRIKKYENLVPSIRPSDKLTKMLMNIRWEVLSSATSSVECSCSLDIDLYYPCRPRAGRRDTRARSARP